MLADTPLGLWPCDDTVGSSTARDISGNNHAATATSMTFGQTPPPGGTASVLSGASSLMLMNSASFPVPPASLEGWINLAAAAVSSQPLWFNNATAQLIIYTGNGNATVRVQSGTTITGPSYSVGTWAHVVVTMDAAGHTILYINGASVATGTLTPWTVGGSNQFARVLQGLGANFATYNTVLSAARVLAHYTAATVVAISGSETGSGSDANPSIGVPVSETGSGTEGTGSVALAAAESGSGIDSVPSLGMALADTGSGSEANPTVALTLTDAGSGTDALAALLAALTGPDSGAGADVASLLVRSTQADSGAGAEAILGSVVVGASESGSGSDLAALLIAFTQAEGGGGLDAELVALLRTPGCVAVSVSKTAMLALSASKVSNVAVTAGKVTNLAIQVESC